MITKSISKTGNSQSVNLDKNLLESVGLQAGDKVHLHVSGRSIVLTPAEGTMPQESFDNALNKVNHQYSELFKRLA